MLQTSIGNVLWSADDFIDSSQSLAATVVAYFILMWLLEWASILFFRFGCKPGPILGKSRNRAILGRSISNVATFAVMGWAGLDALANHGGWASHAASMVSQFDLDSNSIWSAAMGQGILSLVTNDNELARLVGYGSSARVYLFSGRSQRLCVLQLCFQAKNFIDTLVHGDGIIFAFHHVATGALAYFALAPYLHLYAPFFFGISEISTLFIAILVNFDDQQGIKGMAERFPITMTVCGGTFAVLFILFRVIVWPLVGLHFWRDGLAQFGYSGRVQVAGMAFVIGGSTTSGVAPMHSPAVVGLFLVVNIGLTLLQVIWLKEILEKIITILRGEKIAGSKPISQPEGKNC